MAPDDGRPKRVGRSLKVTRRPAAPVEEPPAAEDPGEGTSSTVQPPPQVQQRGADLITLDLLALVPGEPNDISQQTPLASEVLSDEEEPPPGPASPPPRGALPAEERLMRERTRLRRVSLLTNVGQSLLEHCQEETRRAAAADQAMHTLQAQERKKLRAILRDSNQSLRESVEEVRQIRRLMERAVLVMETANPPQITVNVPPHQHQHHHLHHPLHQPPL
ncbi:uncharacterized protein LOC143831172 [Paroedura picta]|uniref:uncharacterized protein LOC143831172 n=1 Tax=Paroedura picta TaxID=143630 RepID=UPI004055AFD3